MFFKAFASVTVALKNGKQSSANRRWEIIGAFLQILTPFDECRQSFCTYDEQIQ
jgi:hypothetical protein